MKVTCSTIVIVIFMHFSTNTFAKQMLINLTGVGATFPAPLYIQWANNYQKETGKKINYQGIGSFGGIKQIRANTVDFAASDMPLSNTKIYQTDLFQFPTVIGGVVLIINLPGIKSNELLLDGKTLGDIYLGKIKTWNHESIVRLNPNLKIFSNKIIVIRRSDASGTSFVFTNYLAKVNKTWRSKIGVGSIINWPVGLGGRGNDGVTALVQRLPGSIGYVEYTYSKQKNLIYTKLNSADGKPVSPSITSFINAAKNVDWNKNFAQDLTNQKGQNVWPITSTTFILVHKYQKNIARVIEVLNFFGWAYKNGIQEAKNLGYANLPDDVVEQIRIAWKTNITSRITHSSSQ